MLEMLLGVLIGAIITWLFSWYYFKQAGEELREESKKLRQTIGVLARWLVDSGVSKDTFRYDEEGNIIGVNAKAGVRFKGCSKLDINGRVIKRNNN